MQFARPSSHFLRVQIPFSLFLKSNSLTRSSSYLPSIVLSFLSTHPSIHFLFCPHFVVLCLAKQTKRMTLGHCYTPGDRAATWSKIANEGGASKRKRYTDRKVLKNRPVTFFFFFCLVEPQQLLKSLKTLDLTRRMLRQFCRHSYVRYCRLWISIV